MRCFHIRILLALMATSQLVGCAQPEQRQPSAMQMAPAVNRPADNYEWVKRLQAAKPIEGVQQVSATAANRVAFPIQMPPDASSQYSLVVDPGMQLAWLQSYGNTTGPWRLDHPDVDKLLKSVSNLQTGPTAVQ